MNLQTHTQTHTLYVGLGGTEITIYSPHVQQVIKQLLHDNKYVFDLSIDGRVHHFDFINMVHTLPYNSYYVVPQWYTADNVTTRRANQYAIREYGSDCSAAFYKGHDYDDKNARIPYPKLISDTICECVKLQQSANITMDIDKKLYSERCDIDGRASKMRAYYTAVAMRDHYQEFDIEIADINPKCVTVVE